MGARLLKTLLWALLALVVGYAVAMGVGLVAFDVFEVSQREGAAAMGLAFFICPMVAVISAFAAAVWYWVASDGRSKEEKAEAGRHRPLFPYLITIAATIIGWQAGAFLQWMLVGQAYETFIVALAVSLAPWAGAAALAVLTWWLVRRFMPAT